MSAKKLIPLLDRVLVEKFVPPSKSVGGVLLPESATQKVGILAILAPAVERPVFKPSLSSI